MTLPGSPFLAYRGNDLYLDEVRLRIGVRTKMIGWDKLEGSAQVQIEDERLSVAS